jgi:hypothetical protein
MFTVTSAQNNEQLQLVIRLQHEGGKDSALLYLQCC